MDKKKYLSFLIRMSPELKFKLEELAKKKNISMNKLVKKKLFGDKW
jgi:predicted HicB family RNase H-like nuclease